MSDNTFDFVARRAELTVLKEMDNILGEGVCDEYTRGFLACLLLIYKHAFGARGALPRTVIEAERLVRLGNVAAYLTSKPPAGA